MLLVGALLVGVLLVGVVVVVGVVVGVVGGLTEMNKTNII